MSDSPRRRIRFLVVEALYEADNSDHPASTVFERRWRDAAADVAKLAKPELGAFGHTAIDGVLEHRPELDDLISGAATRFPLDTMSVVDRNILRLAIWELLTDNAAPVAAVINEAVELAHRYGGESSPGFINGVLRTVSERIRAAHAAGGEPSGAVAPNPISQEI